MTSLLFFAQIYKMITKSERKRIRINHVKKKADRIKYGNLLVVEVNNKLYNGWNPFLEELKEKGVLTLGAAVDEFLKSKRKSLRPDSLRSYTSMCGIFKDWLTAHDLDKKYCVAFDDRIAAAFMRDMEKRDNVSNKTYNNYICFYSTLFLWFVKRNYCPSNPFENIEVLVINHYQLTFTASISQRIFSALLLSIWKLIFFGTDLTPLINIKRVWSSGVSVFGRKRFSTSLSFARGR